MSDLCSKKDKNGVFCIIHIRKNITTKISPFNDTTWNVALRAAEIRGHELYCKGMLNKMSQFCSYLK